MGLSYKDARVLRLVGAEQKKIAICLSAVLKESFCKLSSLCHNEEYDGSNETHDDEANNPQCFFAVGNGFIFDHHYDSQNAVSKTGNGSNYNRKHHLRTEYPSKEFPRCTVVYVIMIIECKAKDGLYVKNKEACCCNGGSDEQQQEEIVPGHFYFKVTKLTEGLQSFKQTPPSAALPLHRLHHCKGWPLYQENNSLRLLSWVAAHAAAVQMYKMK